MKGTYTLLLVCKRSFRTKIGKLGYVNVRKGHYLYTGSALGQGAVSLEGRLRRHRQVSKKTRWHIDYFTAKRNCTVSVAVCLRSRQRLECSINRALARRLNVRPVFPRAGSSDCACEAHLVKVVSSMSDRRVLDAVIRVYEDFRQLNQFSSDTASKSRGLLPIYSRKRRERF